MSHLETFYVEDWAEFIQQHDIDLSCPACRGSGEVEDPDDEDVTECCEDCGGIGYIEPMWNTIWNTGFCAKGDLPCEPGPSVFAFEWQDKIWFGLTACGMDLTPCLALAWINLFADCQWLPDQFCVTGCNLRGGYVESCVGADDAKCIYDVMRKTFEGTIRNAQFDLKDLDAAVARLEGKKRT